MLGPVEAVRDGVPVALGGPRQRALLALLLVDAPRAVAIDRLADELWHDEPPDAAAATIRAYVSKLRTTLGAGAGISGDRAGYAIDVAPDQLDAARFERLTDEGHDALRRGAPGRAAARLRAGLGLWRGPPFAGLGDEGRLHLEGQRLEDVRLAALEDRIEADLELGQHAELVDDLEALVHDHPYRERLWRLLMLALYRAERQTDALAAYRRARTRLDEDLGLEPGQELQRLEQSILRHEVPVVQPPEERHNLPASVSSFVGRETELSDIERLLETGRLVTLTGVGGVGKTRLGIQAARRAIADSPDGVFLVDLSAIADPMLVDRQIATSLEIREQSDASLADQLQKRLRDADLLLLLDNCEHVRDACAEISGRLLGSCPGLRVLATSREALGIPGEVDYPVSPLAVPPASADLDELGASDAVRLFLARASEAQPRRSDAPGALEMAARICRDLDGLPLAIELAAARTKALSLEEIASRLDDRFQFLVSWRRLSPARHRTLRAAMDWSYELLSETERTLLDRVSVFAGGFTLEAVESVAARDLDGPVVDVIGRLVDASLLVPEERGGGMRYRLLETVRQYAAELLAERGETAALRRAHAHHFLAFAETVPTRGAAQSGGLRQLDAEVDNLRSAVEWAAGSGDLETELRFVAALWPYWHVRGHLAEGRARVEAALDHDGIAALGAYNRAIFGAGILAWSVGDYGRARALADELLAAAEVSGSHVDEHAAYKLLSHVALRERDYAASERYSQETLALARLLESDHDISTAQLNLAVVYLDWGKVESAIPMLEEVLEYNRRNGIAEGTGLALLNLGEAAYHLGDLARAKTRFEEAREALESLGFTAHVGHALTGLAGVEVSSGRHEEAARLLGRADALLFAVGASTDDFDPSLSASVEAAARGHLGDDGFAAAYAAGRSAAGSDAT